MSSGRYELLVREEMENLQSRSGLDLDVYDYHTGKVRSIRSLSGGESFQAALSLALGVSGVIGQFAGGIRVETVFVDEGFGSLDEQSLEGERGGNSTEEVVALLNELLSHNEHHSHELDQMADNLSKLGMEDAAKTIKEGVADFQKGNMRLGLALTLVKEHLKEA